MYNRTMPERITMDGRWSFWPDRHHVTDERWLTAEERRKALGDARSITVPGVWQAQFDDLRLFSGVAWYERSTLVPSRWSDRIVRLCFGAVDYLCSVWINGVTAGSHEGGYLPFALDITDKVRWGFENTITVRVLDPGPGDRGPVPFAEIPHGKQSWYGPLGGLWQSVYLEARPRTFAGQVAIDASVDSATARVRVTFGRAAIGGERVECRVASPDRHSTWTEMVDPVERGASGVETAIPVGVPERWDIDAPRLYSLDIRCHNADGSIDEVTELFGWRKIAAGDGRLWLNDRPLYLLGALDQDYYHRTIATPPSNDVLRDQMIRARELGLNLLRCHIKTPDPRYLRWADRLGILVWAELPNWSEMSKDAAARARATLEGIIERDRNHPSIVIWTIVNEGWGLDLARDERHREWLRETLAWVRALDSNRLIVDNSPCPPNFHIESDINDWHIYRAIPDWCDEWTDWVDGWVADPSITYSPFGDARRSGAEPQVISEFGNWGLPDLRDLVDDDGSEPWWFDTGEEWGGGTVQPRGVQRRFFEWGLDDVFGSWDGFVAASQEHQFEGLRFQIEDLRRRPEIAGYVITEFTDVHWECNGLLDVARNPKRFDHRFTEINAPDVVIARPARYRYRTGEAVEVQTIVAHWSDADADGWSIEWSLDGFDLRGRLDGVSVDRASVETAGVVSFAAPAVETCRRSALRVSLRDRHGREVNRNSVPLLFFAHSDRARYEGLVKSRLDDAVLGEVEGGARVVVVATSRDALPGGVALSIEERRGSVWKGDWAQGMTWFRRSLTEGLPLLARMDITFAGLTPSHVIRGYAPIDKDDVLSGYYLGWIHATVANIGAFSHGSGAGIVCTLPLLADGGADPLGAALLTRLCDLATTPGFAPGKRL